MSEASTFPQLEGADSTRYLGVGMFHGGLLVALSIGRPAMVRLCSWNDGMNECHGLPVWPTGSCSRTFVLAMYGITAGSSFVLLVAACIWWVHPSP